MLLKTTLIYLPELEKLLKTTLMYLIDHTEVELVPL